MTRDIQLLTFSLDQRLHALPLSQVHRVIRSVDATPLPHAPDVVMGVIDLAGDILPLMNIRRRFGLPDRGIDVDDQFIIANMSGRSVALLVDNVKGVVERPAGDILAAKTIVPGLDQIDGVVQLDDDLMLIHDLGRFLSLEEEHVLADAFRGEGKHENDCL